MNEGFKSFIIGFFSAVGVAVAGIFAVLFGKNGRRTAGDAGDAIDRAGEVAERAEDANRKLADAIGGAEESAGGISDLNKRIADSVAESRRILDELKKRHPKE